MTYGDMWDCVVISSWLPHLDRMQPRCTYRIYTPGDFVLHCKGLRCKSHSKQASYPQFTYQNVNFLILTVSNHVGASNSFLIGTIISSGHLFKDNCHTTSSTKYLGNIKPRDDVLATAI